jgi:glucose-6-phosphate dehydrogenase assembly protein OpcA
VSPGALVAGPPRAVRVGAVEHELARPWRHPAAAQEDPPATSALMANLVVFCRDDAEGQGLTRDIAAIVPSHPSRVILLIADPGSDSDEIAASVATHGRLAGGSQQVCGEVVTLRAGAPATGRLPATVRSLLLGDLPTALWWATPDAPPLAGDLFTDLSRLADQVIYDSFGWTDPLRQIVVTAGWVAGPSQAASGATSITSDLAWRRPKLWRRLIAQSLDPGLAPGALDAITEVHIEHGPHALTQAWLLTGWLAFRLGWQPRGGKVLPGPEVSWSFQSEHGNPRVHIKRLPDGVSDLRAIRVVTRVGSRPVTFRFELSEPGRVSVVADGLSDRVLSIAGPVQARAELVARQLPDIARDRLFQSSIALARTMAEAVL